MEILILQLWQQLWVRSQLWSEEESLKMNKIIRIMVMASSMTTAVTDHLMWGNLNQPMPLDQWQGRISNNCKEQIFKKRSSLHLPKLNNKMCFNLRPQIHLPLNKWTAKLEQSNLYLQQEQIIIMGQNKIIWQMWSKRGKSRITISKES